jgi:hypothetical protein
MAGHIEVCNLCQTVRSLKIWYFTFMDIVYNGLSVQGVCHVRIQSVFVLGHKNSVYLQLFC